MRVNSIAEFCREALGLALVLLCWSLVAPQPSWADWVCDGDRLSVEITRGAVDAWDPAGHSQLPEEPAGRQFWCAGAILSCSFLAPITRVYPVTPTVVGGGALRMLQRRNSSNLGNGDSPRMRTDGCLISVMHDGACGSWPCGSLTITSLALKVRPAACAHHDPAGLSVGGHAEVHGARSSAVFTTKLLVFPQFDRCLFRSTLGSWVLLRHVLSSHGNDGLVSNRWFSSISIVGESENQLRSLRFQPLVSGMPCSSQASAICFPRRFAKPQFSLGSHVQALWKSCE